MAIPKETIKSVRLTREDAKIVQTIEKQLQVTHGRLTFTHIVRMALRSLAGDKQQVA